MTAGSAAGAGRGFEDPLDPYRDGDDGSLRYAEQQTEKAREDRRRDTGSRGVTVN